MGLSEVMRASGHNVYVLLDGALLDVLKLVYSHDASPVFDQLYRSTLHQAALEVSPCIIQPSEASRLWEAEHSWRSAGVVMESNADIQTVADHMRTLISVRLPEQAFAYLRFYSPGQIGALFSTFTPEESARFSGPVRKWHYFDPDGGWKRIEIPNLEQSYETGEEGWFQLTEEHIRIIEAHNETAFINKLVKNADLPLTPENVSLMRVLVEQGRSYGFCTQRHLASYTEMAAHYRNTIHQTDALGILADTERPARERLAELDNLMAHGGA